MSNKERKNKIISGPWIIMITLVSALAVSYYHWNRHVDQVQLYTEVMQNYVPPAAQKLDKSTAPNIVDAVAEYGKKNFDESYQLFESVQSKTDSIYWYLSHIALIKGEVYKARNHAMKINDSELKNDILKYVNAIL